MAESAENWFEIWTQTWQGGWENNWPYQPIDIVTKLDEICLWKPSKPQRQGVSWQAPPNNLLKWNVDGSSNGKPGNAGIGGVLRDHCGLILYKFAASEGIRESNEAEFLAIVFALETSLQQPWIMDKDIIIESDSTNAVSWVKKEGDCPWRLRFMRNKLENILKLLKRVIFQHKCREANHIADALAKQGAQMEGTWIEWNNN